MQDIILFIPKCGINVQYGLLYDHLNYPICQQDIPYFKPFYKKPLKKLQDKKISIQCTNEHFEVFHFGFLAYYVQLLHIYVNAINNIAVICVVIHPIASTGLKFKNLGKLQNHTTIGQNRNPIKHTSRQNMSYCLAYRKQCFKL